MLDNKSLHFPKDQKNRDIDNRDNPKDESSHNPITTDEKNCSDEDNEIFVYS